MAFFNGGISKRSLGHIFFDVLLLSEQHIFYFTGFINASWLLYHLVTLLMRSWILFTWSVYFYHVHMTEYHLQKLIFFLAGLCSLAGPVFIC